MKNKFLNAEFGYCPRVLCDRQIVLPIAMSEDLSISRVKVFCPKCEDVYVPRNRFVDIDGAYFGCSFPSVFFQTFPDPEPLKECLSPLCPEIICVVVVTPGPNPTPRDDVPLTTDLNDVVVVFILNIK